MGSMDVDPIVVYYYQTGSGRCPFQNWFEGLDRQIQIIIDARLARVKGQSGDINVARDNWADYLRRTQK